ncbi:HD domain-containing protein [Candidatus Uhrbacteria bacterium]|nr:MAG: HD domain-containing protein [Candidatus Uhrbacteria bacterium]
MELAQAIDLIKRSIPSAYLVGGFVRDELLGITSKDADIEVFGMASEELEKRLHELFDGNVVTVGRSFGVFKVMLGGGVDVDVAIPRRESKSGKGHKDFVVEGDPTMTIEEAARRRDFTINAMYRDLASGALVDPYGGADDLKNKVLKAVEVKTFGEDPLRVYRAVQFVARFGLTVEEETFELMKGMVEDGELDHLPAERVTGEIKKLLLQAERPSIGFEAMRALGIIEMYYPELLVLEDTPQEPDWHPEGDVWIHTMMVVDQASRIARHASSNPFEQFTDEERLQIVLGALCHDLGKPSTTAIGEKDGVQRIRSLGHEEAGVEPTKLLLAKWTFGQAALEAALASAKEHLKPGMLSMTVDKGQMNEEQYVNSVRKLLKRIHPISWRILLAIAESDYRGRTIPGVDTEPYLAGERMRQTIRTFKLDEAPTKPLISGSDLIPLGVKPGPGMGEIIKKVETARDAGEIKTREEALEMATNILKSPAE